VGLPRFILDLRKRPAAGALGTWIAEPQKQRKMGWGGVPPDDPSTAYLVVSTYVRWVLPKAFDALVYIEESTATALLK
jgi:hypothetical protein